MPYTLWMVLFDGEEAQREQWGGTDNDYGSRHLVQRLSAEGELNRVKALLLVDMIGDAKLDIRQDPERHHGLPSWNSAQRGVSATTATSSIRNIR